MEMRRKNNDNTLGIGVSLICLGLCYWFIWKNPTDTHAQPSGLSIEQSRQTLEMSRAWMREGKYDLSLESTLKLVKFYPNNPIYWDQLATVYGHLKRYSQQIDALRKYIELAATPSDACPRLIEAYRKLHLLKEMVAICENCVEWEPTNSDLIFSQGQAYEWSKDFERAKQSYKKAMALAPRNPDPALGLARVSLFTGDSSAARSLASKVIQDNPDAGSDALLVMGMVLRSEGHLLQAREFLERGVKKSPQYTDFYLILGGISEQEGNRPAAKNYYHQALKSDPGNEQATSRLRIIGENP